MKKLLLILFVFGFASYSVSAQSIQFVQGLTLNRHNFALSNDVRVDKFNSTGFNFGVEWLYRTKLKQYPRKVSLTFFDFQSEYFYRAAYSNDREYDVINRARYASLGWTPLYFRALDEKFEYMVGVDLLLKLSDRSLLRRNQTENLGGAQISLDRFNLYKLKSIAFAFVIQCSYLFELSDHLHIAPRAGIRITELDTDNSSVYIWNLELTARYDLE